MGQVNNETSARAEAPERAAADGHRNNPVRDLQRLGQSVWLDDLRRSLFTSGEFERLIAEDGLRGVTSNPSIFERAIASETDYLVDIQRHRTLEPMALYERLAISDIREAADRLRPVYETTERADGFASLEVSPRLGHDTRGTIDEARRLWKAVDRDNVMIKVPASKEGLPAIRQLTSEGVNVNITLLFGVERYVEVAQAFLAGLSQFVRDGGDASRVSSVASFFVSRIDTAVDALIADRLRGDVDSVTRASLDGLAGTVAIANARNAYDRYLDICRTEDWQRLARAGARPQRLLWASTSTKNPAYRDVRYVEGLIGRETVNTMTPATLAAFRDHGQVRATLEGDVNEARSVIERLERTGISLREVTDGLLEEGLTRFSDAFDKLLAAVNEARTKGTPQRVPV